MAVVKKLYYEKSKDIIAKQDSEVAMEYNWDDYYFGIWSYKNGDLLREYGIKQNLQINRRFAEEIYTALGKFLNK